MRKLTAIILCLVAGIVFFKPAESGKGNKGPDRALSEPREKQSKTTQVRIFTISKGKMNEFVNAWLRGVHPLRTKFGFKIEGAWTVQNKNKFIWILSYDGPEGFQARDSAYYASEARNKLEPDPRDYISDVEAYFLNAVIKD